LSRALRLHAVPRYEIDSNKSGYNKGNEQSAEYCLFMSFIICNLRHKVQYCDGGYMQHAGSDVMCFRYDSTVFEVDLFYLCKSADILTVMKCLKTELLLGRSKC
jgi:hypothetical protein